MKKLLFLSALLMATAGCYLDSKETSEKDNGWKVELCFDHEGYKIYRFHDGQHYRYYVTPEGTVSGQYSSGKHVEQEEITTVGQPELRSR